MLVTKRLETKVEQLSLEDMDFDQVRRDYELDLAMEMAEINFIQTDADKLAIEAYVDYNGNETMLESYYVTLTENAVSDIGARLKRMFDAFISFISKYLQKFANFVKGLFNNNQAFINKYGEDTTVVTINYIDFDKAGKKIINYLNDYEKFIEFTLANPVTLGSKIAGLNKDEYKANKFDSIVNNRSFIMLDHEYDKNTFEKDVKEDIMEASSTKIALNDFCKELQTFMNLNKTINSMMDVRKLNKIISIMDKIAKKSNVPSVIEITEIASICTSFLSKLLSAITQSYRDVITNNIAEVNKAIKGSN